MALYDGFFDAVKDEDTGEYDRAYNSGDFTNYFAQIIGSGVCIHENPDSFLVRLENGAAVVSPGYLFIQGYWLKNDADYTVDLPGNNTYAIVAHLNLGKRMIELEARSVSQAYPDSLVLAIVSPTSAEDTRRNTDICGIIDTAGELSTKVKWAINYIDNEIESKLAQAEQDIAAQALKLDAKIAEVQAVADSIVPPPVGTIKFSASQDVGEEWLLCDGSFINEQDYPELVSALGKLIPSGDKFQIISSGEIGQQISNGVVYDGRLWVYSYSAQKLYGVDLTGTETIKEISVTSEDPYFVNAHPPTTQQPIALSIVASPVDNKVRVFVAQILANANLSTTSTESRDKIWIYVGEFQTNQNSIVLEPAFTKISYSTGQFAKINYSDCFPSVISYSENGLEYFYCAIGFYDSFSPSRLGYYARWKTDSEAVGMSMSGTSDSGTLYFNSCQRIGYIKQNKKESVFVRSSGSYSSSMMLTTYSTGVVSKLNELFSRSYVLLNTNIDTNQNITTPNPLNIVGQTKLMFGMSKTAVMSVSLDDLDTPKIVQTGLPVPSAARIFVDGASYLWGKDIYMIFVGTGIIFSRTLEEGSFGYLDTTSVLGTITQFGYLDYSQDEGTLYLMGQDTANAVKVAKIVLNTLYDYANDGAWLPMIAADGVPAYIKATGSADAGGKVSMTITVLQPAGSFDSQAYVLFNGEVLIAGTYTRQVPENGTFSIGYRTYAMPTASSTVSVKLNGATAVSGPANVPIGTEKTASLNVVDHISNGITLQGAN